MRDLQATRTAGDGINVPVSAADASALSPAGIRSAVAELLRDLGERPRRILGRRFGLDGGVPQTLQAIGAAEGVTRERIRQIEQAALRVFREGSETPAAGRPSNLSHVRDTLVSLLRTLGGVAREDILAGLLGLREAADLAALKLLVTSLTDIADVRETDRFVRHFRQKGGVAVDQMLEHAKSALQEVGHLLPDRAFLTEIRRRATLTLEEAALRSVLSVSREIVRTPFGEWGMRGWVEATPRGVGDKAYVVLKRANKPLHFTAIAEAINAANFDRRTAHAQTVHNELIRDGRFVLVGRGLYALRKWGYEPGTVAVVLERILRAAGRPLPREELVAAVLKERIVKRNTILLALQNRQRFLRTPEGEYALAGAETHHTHTHSSPDAGREAPEVREAAADGPHPLEDSPRDRR